VREYNVNIDERFENITDPYTLGRIIIVKALKNTAIASLANFDIGKLQKGISETVRKTTEKFQEAKDRTIKAIEAEKERGEKIQETARETVEKATDAIKKILPFGKKEDK